MVFAFKELMCIGGLVETKQTNKNKKTIDNDICHKDTQTGQ